MLNAIIQLATCVAGMFVILGTWYAIQSYTRWRSGCGRDRDLLEYMAHGCASCNRQGHCGRLQAAEEEHDHESA